MNTFIKNVFLFSSVAPLLSACGGGSFYVPQQYPIVPSAATSSVGSLEIFRNGENSALSSLEGNPQETIFLEVKGGDPQYTPKWFSSSVLYGDFLRPGKLTLRGVGEFEVRVFVGPLAKTLPVRVVSSSNVIPVDMIGATTGLLPPPEEKSPMPASNIPPPVASDPFMDEVISFRPGSYAGFGASEFPDIVLGPPQGGGTSSGGFDVLSLGVGGEIILRSDAPLLDGEGFDFIVFENPFYAGGDPNNPYVELGEVAVSQDGVRFFTFPCETENRLERYPDCAGVRPVLANSETNSIDPTDPQTAGGDLFDLEELGLDWAQYIRILDLSTEGLGNSAGFDLDAIGIVYQ